MTIRNCVCPIMTAGWMARHWVATKGSPNTNPCDHPGHWVFCIGTECSLYDSLAERCSFHSESRNIRVDK